MEEKYGIPLFNKSDTVPAIDLIAEAIIESKSLPGVIDDNGNAQPLDKTVAKQLAMNIFGINAHIIANMLIVQDTFSRTYKNSILRYFEYANVHDIEVISVPYSTIREINTTALVSGISVAKPLGMVVCPSTSLTDINDVKRVIATNSLLSFQETYIKIPAYHEHSGIQKFTAELFHYEVGSVPSGTILYYKALPNNSFYSIQNFIQLLHKYI